MRGVGETVKTIKIRHCTPFLLDKKRWKFQRFFSFRHSFFTRKSNVAADKTDIFSYK